MSTSTCVKTRTRNNSFVQELLNKKSLLISYIRDFPGSDPLGVVVAVKTSDGFQLGWSVCNLSKDHWDKYLGLRIAIGRALSGKGYNPHQSSIGDLVEYEVYRMQIRANKYWKVNQ